MTRGEKRRRLTQFVRFYQPLLGLHDWYLEARYVNTRAEMPDEPCQACCDSKPAYQEAVVYFAVDEIPDRDLAATVRHELVHPIVSPLEDVVDFLIQCYAPGNKVLQKMAGDALERVTSDVERLLARHLPRPPG